MRYESTSRGVGLLLTRCPWGFGQEAELPRTCLLLTIVCWKFSARFRLRPWYFLLPAAEGSEIQVQRTPESLIDAPPGQALPFSSDRRPGSLGSSVGGRGPGGKPRTPWVRYQTLPWPPGICSQCPQPSALRACRF